MACTPKPIRRLNKRNAMHIRRTQDRVNRLMRRYAETVRTLGLQVAAASNDVKTFDEAARSRS